MIPHLLEQLNWGEKWLADMEKDIRLLKAEIKRHKQTLKKLQGEVEGTEETEDGEGTDHSGD